MEAADSIAELIGVRATVNDWLSRQFPVHRKNLVHGKPVRLADSWCIPFHAWAEGKRASSLGSVLVSLEFDILKAPETDKVVFEVSDFLRWVTECDSPPAPELTEGDRYAFRLGYGIEAAQH